MTPLIKMENVSKRYPGGFALKNVTLTVNPGEIVGFVGANGAGKSTTIRAILGLGAVESGTVELFGKPFGSWAGNALARDVKGRISVVTDVTPDPQEMTAGDYAGIIAAAYPNWDQALFDSLCQALEITGDPKIKELSRGMGMKLQIACALSHHPQLLVMDEATAGLDPYVRDQVLDYFKDYVRENPDSGILLSSHITTDLERIADTIVGIAHGEITFTLDKSEITDDMGVAVVGDQVFRALQQDTLVDWGKVLTITRGNTVEMLLPERREFAKRHPSVAVERCTIDEYLRFHRENAPDGGAGNGPSIDFSFKG